MPFTLDVQQPVQEVRKDPRYNDAGVMEWLRNMQRALAIRCRLEAEGLPSMKSAVEEVIMPVIGLSHEDAHHMMNIIEYHDMRKPADVERVYKIKLD